MDSLCDFRMVYMRSTWFAGILNRNIRLHSGQRGQRGQNRRFSFKCPRWSKRVFILPILRKSSLMFRKYEYSQAIKAMRQQVLEQTYV